MKPQAAVPDSTGPDHRGQRDDDRADGSRVCDGCRLIATLTDDRRFPAAAVVRLNHEGWVRHEVACCEWNSRKEDRLMSVT